MLLAAAVQALAVIALTYWVGRVEGIETKLDGHEKWSNNKVVEFESRIRANEERNNEILRRLDRIEGKLDRLDFPKVR